MCESKGTEVVSWYKTKTERKEYPHFKYGFVYFGSHYLNRTRNKIEMSKNCRSNLKKKLDRNFPCRQAGRVGLRTL
jgi:hypothetical protein